MASTAEYWVGESIGEGSFGIVLHGRLKSTALDVAIKCIDKNSMKQQPASKKSTSHAPTAVAVVQEQRILKLLKDCSYTVKLYASFHDAECVYLVTECCTGGTLQDMIAASSTESSSASASASASWRAHYGLQILEGLAYLHATARIVHCDIKPDNMLLTSAGRIKLADFGCAVDLSRQAKPTPIPAAQQQQKAETTRNRMPLRGTAAYSPPELIRAAEVVTPAVDLWSFGCVLYALWSGTSPFSDDNNNNNAGNDNTNTTTSTEAGTIQAITAYCQLPETARSSHLFGTKDHNTADLFGTKDHNTADDNTTTTTETAGTDQPTETAGIARTPHLLGKDHHTNVPDEWKALIVGLLNPVPIDRLGAKDAFAAITTKTTATIPATVNSSDSVRAAGTAAAAGTVIIVYPSIRSSTVWKGVDLTKDPAVLPPVPAWWEKAGKATQSTMKDGKDGWSAFLV